MVKIDIVSGFLGAGKTTLIKKLLKDAFQGEQVVLIENEFGEIGIDGGFLKEAGIQIREMNSGCICCSLVGDFGASLKEVVEKYHPDRILIEPSGVGKLSDVIKAVQGVEKEVDITLNSYTTVVDAKKCKMYMRNFGEFFNNQVEYAGAIIMSRTDIVDEEKATKAMELLREINKNAAIITTPIEKLEGKKLLEVMEHPVSLEEELLKEEHEHHHHHHDDDDDCCCHDHDHEHHHHDDDDDHEHEHHHHHHDHDDDECDCHEHHHDHDEHEHHHDHDEHEHHHDHDEHEHHHEHGEGCTCGCHDHDHEHGHHHADDVFTSWGKETPHKFERAKLEEILKQFVEDDKILRSKGMVEGTDGKWIYFDMVPGEYEIRDGEPDYTGRIVVIGTDIHEHELEELFGLA